LLLFWQHRYFFNGLQKWQKWRGCIRTRPDPLASCIRIQSSEDLRIRIRKKVLTDPEHRYMAFKDILQDDFVKFSLYFACVPILVKWLLLLFFRSNTILTSSTQSSTRKKCLKCIPKIQPSRFVIWVKHFRVLLYKYTK
jgi:hypothetical protein